MRFLVVALLVVIGLSLVGLGLRPLLTGKNYSGVMGRGLTKNDDARLKRAPAAFFRALGAMLGAFGALFVYFGIVLAVVPDHTQTSLVILIFAVAGLFVIAELGCVVWMIVLSRRYRLFRWDEP